jgi:hypothetical protein
MHLGIAVPLVAKLAASCSVTHIAEHDCFEAAFMDQREAFDFYRKQLVEAFWRDDAVAFQSASSMLEKMIKDQRTEKGFIKLGKFWTKSPLHFVRKKNLQSARRHTP